MNIPRHDARLTVHSREQVVARIPSGQTAAEVAAAFAVSVRTARKGLARFSAGGLSKRHDTRRKPAAWWDG